ncbi:MAG: sigma-E processing peptidase SpoIIGA [Clostridia bacterium]|nr:sigma-E processing peptidase SpoIIGA [Clostridia bacterium]
MPTVYVDVLFAVNLLINYILINASGILAKISRSKLRIGFGAFIGASYSLLIFFPDFSMLFTTICKLLISMLIVAASFPFYTLRSYIKTLIIFYMVSFGFGGCVLGVFYFSDIGARLGAVYSNGIFYFNLPWTVLALSGILFYLAIKICGIISAKFYRGENLRKKLRISLGEKTAELTALLDTGNALIDPVTLSPVIIAEYKSLKPLFSPDMQFGLNRLGSDNITWVMSEVSEYGLKVRLIPFSSLGKENGMLLGFVPDHAEIRDDCGVRVLDKCVIGIYERQLSKDKSYTALFNPYL